MNIRNLYLPVILLIILAIAVGLFRILSHRIPHAAEQVDHEAALFPDYAGITIPVNCAPLNFSIRENGIRYRVRFSSGQKRSYTIPSRHSKIRIPARVWKKLLNASVNGELQMELFGKLEDGRWVRYKPVTNRVVNDKIDAYVAFRQINTGYILWEKMGIYQRNVENFRQSPILINEKTDRNCMNCHTFCNNDPEKMVLHLRRPPSGTLLYNKGEVQFLNTGTKYTMSPAVYPAWHPGGDLVAFSVNIIRQRFHAAGEELIYVYDLASDIIVYDIKKNQVTTCPSLSTGRLENMPAWSHDGRYLYYISGPKYDKTRPDSLVKYDLLRIAYHAEDRRWGSVDTLLTARETGKSITYPQLSPDDKFITFALSDYGYFNVFSNSSDLYIMSADTRNYSALSVNSSRAESFHGWSSNGKWILFASKRMDGLFSRVFFSHIDASGKASKPFVLPQKDPDYYTRNTLNFNRPVFLSDRVSVPVNRLVRAANPAKSIDVEFDPDVEIDALSGATRIERDVMKEHTN